MTGKTSNIENPVIITHCPILSDSGIPDVCVPVFRRGATFSRDDFIALAEYAEYAGLEADWHENRRGNVRHVRIDAVNTIRDIATGQYLHVYKTRYSLGGRLKRRVVMDWTGRPVKGGEMIVFVYYICSVRSSGGERPALVRVAADGEYEKEYAYAIAKRDVGTPTPTSFRKAPAEVIPADEDAWVAAGGKRNCVGAVLL